MPTIYEQTAGSLIAQPDRSVATFDSGLIRVDQTFVGTTQNAETHRATLAVGNDFPGDTSPGIDGLFIFPAPQETRTGDGLTTFMVSGYGRSTDQLISQRRGTITTTIRSSYVEDSGGVPTTPHPRDFAFITTNSVVGKIAVLAEEGLTYEQLNFDPSFSEPLALLPIDPDDVIEEISRTSTTQNAVSWDGQVYTKTLTTVKIGKTFSNGTKLVAFYSYDTPVIGIDFSTSYGNFTELGINVSAPIGNPINTITIE
jgi:hypothetical protein